MLHKVRAICFFLLITANMLYSQSNYAQSNEQFKIDSLLTRIAQANDDTNKVNLLCELMSNHVYYNE